ncbi:MAG: efflux RND transporter periplasmic adaptor subunit [Bradymonadaceae bacterium]
MNRTKLIALLTVAALVGAGTSYGLAQWFGAGNASASSETSQGGSSGKTGGQSSDSGTTYTCSMHPSVEKDEPGNCPICGMPLVEKKSGSGAMSPEELAKLEQVSVSPAQRVLANVKTARVEKRAVADRIRAVGNVVYDETKQTTIPSWIGGRIDRLFVEESGTRVQRGQKIALVYSEQLVTAQEEFLVAVESGSKDVAQRLRRRLELLGMRKSQIDRIEARGEPMEDVPIFATSGGTITEIKVREGQYVNEGQPLFEVADLSTIWVEAQIYQSEIADVHEGMEVRVETEAYPDETFRGTVTLVHPMVKPRTRTNRVRIEFDKPVPKLKPGMFTEVYFEVSADEDGVLAVPASAVIYGGQAQHVYVEIEKGVFERREVEVGHQIDDYVNVLSGLKAGQQVAYQGGFLIDSELQLNSFNAGSGSEDSSGSSSSEDDKHGSMKKDGSGGMKMKKEKVETDLSASDIPEGGKKFSPPVTDESVPSGTWYCSMGHWIQPKKGDGTCPVCGMKLQHKK